MRFLAIASGSNGNCFLLDTPHEALLIDNGTSFRRIRKELSNLRIPLSKIKYILVTHAHSDHIQGLPVFCANSNARVIATPETLNEIKLKGMRGDKRFIRIGDTGVGIQLEDPVLFREFEITTYATYHDIEGASGYHIRHLPTDLELSYATDTADISAQFREQMKISDAIVLESNHCNEMLRNSNRPSSLKRRIQNTHLSNEKSMKILQDVITESTKSVHLAHLSGECNSPGVVAFEINKIWKEKEKMFTWVICPREKKSSIVSLSNSKCIVNGDLNSDSYHPDIVPDTSLNGFFKRF